MIRKDPERSNAKRSKQLASCAATYVGNNRQMLQEIRDHLIHSRKIQSDSCKDPTNSTMQIKTDLPGTAGSTISSSASSTSSLSSHGPKSSLYRQKALAEIRNSLLPFANENGLSSGASTISTVSSTTTSGISSASGLSNASGSSSPCHVGDHHHQNGIGIGGGGGAAGLFLEKNQNPYDDDSASGIRGLKQTRVPYDVSSLDSVYKLQGESQSNGLPKQMAGGLSGLTSKVIRKASFERDMHRMSPALEGSSTASTCSETPSLNSMQVRTLYEQRTSAQLMTTSDSMKAHLQVTRQYSPNFGMEPPPPPPPRLQGPPPTPPRGTTPPLPPTQLQSDFRLAQQPFMPQVQHMLKRISPGPQKTRPAQGMGYNGPQSQSSTPQRGTSPVSVGRSPMVVQNSLQLQLNHQLQSALYNGGQLEPPPPYPIGSAQKLASPPPPPYVPSSRQSPTQVTPSPDYVAATSQQQKRSSPTIYPPLSMGTSSLSMANSTSLKPAPLQAWSTRQPPPIMLSVKSTQVQKPVLQTAVAPAAPPMNSSSTPPPPNYMTAYQQKLEPNPPPVNNYAPAAGNCYLGGPAIAQYATGPGMMSSIIPTTDPPSYASTIQAMAAAQRGGGGNGGGYTNYNLQMCTPAAIPASSTTASGVANAVTCLANNMDVQLRTSSPGSSSVTSSTGESVASTPSQTSSITTGQSNNFQRKYSPMMAVEPSTCLPEQQQSSTAIPFQGEDLNGRAGPTTGNGTSTNTNNMTDSLSCKMALQSPIPERKFLRSDEEDEEEEDSGETKVRNYSPQAFKFYMEQHVENVLKSHQQRLLRRRQLETEMAKVGLSEEAQCQMRKMLHQKESNYIRLKRAKMNKSMFVKIKAIGVGAFGEVALVRKLDTQHLYAMKTLRKADVLKRNQVAHVKAERDILAEADNEWVVKLYYSFQDQENLYFVMDYIPGGDLMSLLIKLNIFQEPLARFYISELVCAVESVHKMGFIHRDIKPDNILIDRDGHIKLTDFGLCTGFRWTHNSKYYQNGDHNRQDSMEPDENWTNDCQCNNLKPLERRWRREHQRCLAHSLVGTPNYIAPEVLMRTGYTQLCDWWSVGVILYEMLVGQPPFLANTPLETQYKVINWENTLKVPRKANLSPESKDLILRLCSSHDRRLGKNGSAEVMSHPYFAGVDFDGGIRRHPAPFTPTIRSPTDTSNFDPVDPDKLRNSDSGDSDDKGNSGYENGKHPEHAFFEFTFRRFFDDGGHAYPTRLGMGVGETDNQGPVYV